MHADLTSNLEVAPNFGRSSRTRRLAAQKARRTFWLASTWASTALAKLKRSWGNRSFDRAMSGTLSIYLDIVRFTAALVVFLGHASDGPVKGTDGLLWQFGALANDAVTIFFVLSGFVIAYVVGTSERSPRQFFTNRAARIYSVVVPAVVLTWALDYIGFLINPSFSHGTMLPRLLPTWVPSALTFTNQVWGAHVSIGSNIPYWSLGYEVWYYVLFGCALFAPRRWAIIGCLAIAVFVGPGIIILFPLWLAGAATYQVIGKITPTRESLGWGLYLGSTILLVVLFYWLVYSPAGSAIDDVPRRYAVGALFIFHLVGFRRVEHQFTTFLHGCENPIRWTAGMTFSLYLYHYPLLAFLGLALPGTPSNMIHRVGMICIPLLVIAGIAQVTERKKSAWRRVIDAMISAGLANINRRSYRTAFWTRKFTLDDPR